MPAAHYNPELLEAARGGDELAITSLLALAQPDLRRYAQYSCSTTEDANDAVQETLWIISRRIGSLRAVTSFTGWVFAIVRRECTRLARRIMGHPTDLAEVENSLLLAHRPALELRIDLALRHPIAPRSLPRNCDSARYRGAEHRRNLPSPWTLPRSRES